MSIVGRFLTAYREQDTGEPGLVQKDDGTVWLVNPDGTEAQLQAPPTTREQFAANAVTINDGASASLTWDGASGTELLDTSSLTSPTIIVAGTYFVAVEFLPFTAMTAGGWYRAQLSLDAGGEAAVVGGDALAIAANTAPELTLSAAYYIPAGGIIRASVTNHDGGAARDFAIISAIVQRL